MTVSVQAKTRRRLGLLFCVPLAFSLLFFFVNLEAERTDLQLLKNQGVTSSVNELFTSAIDLDAGERAFLLTGDEVSLQPFEQARALLPTDIRLLRSHEESRPELKSKIERIAGLVQTRLVQAEQGVKAARAQGTQPAGSAVLGQADATMNSLRLAVSDIRSELNTRQDSYLAHERQMDRWIFILFLGGTLVMICVLLWLYNEVLSFLYARDAAHAQVAALNEELEARIEERTRDLKQANEELQQFAYVASHDLQEPLRTITSFTQLLAARYKGKLDEDADEFIGYVVSSSKRMTDLINGLLAVVRLRKAGQPTAPVPFANLVEDAKITLQVAIRESDARVECGPLPSLVVEPVQFSQLVQNLILNAIKYRRDEPPVIRFEARREMSNWVFSVSDNGRGFNQQFADRIFGLFQRLHSREVEGTGMGLSIARKIVERHGGRIWAESTEGVGSTFYFSLPITLETARSTAGAQAKAAARA